MPRSWMGYLAGAAFVLTATAGAGAYAQGAPAPCRMDHRDGMDRHEERRVIIEGGDRHADMSGRHRHIGEHLRTMLQLKPSQEPALAAYLAAVTPDRDHEHMVQMADRDGDRTTPQRLAEMEKRMAESQAATRVRIAATRKFYDQLDPSQKKVFDEMPLLMIGPMTPRGPMKVRFEHAPMPMRLMSPDPAEPNGQPRS
jgi:protein CpxP